MGMIIEDTISLIGRLTPLAGLIIKLTARREQ